MPEFYPCRPVGELFQCRRAFVGNFFVALLFRHFDELERVFHFLLDFFCGLDAFVQAAAFGHHRLRFGLVIPQCRIFHARVQLVETAQGLIPIERGFYQIQRGVDPVDSRLRVGTHCSFSKFLVPAIRRYDALVKWCVHYPGFCQTRSKMLDCPATMGRKKCRYQLQVFMLG